MNYIKHKIRELAPVAELYPPQGQWAESDYFALPDTNRYVELSEGRLIMPPHPTRSHQIAVEELYIRLRAFVWEHDLGEVHIAPLPVRLWPGKIREPDIFFIAKAHADRIGEQACGVPDLVMEVLSPGTWDTDRGEKFFEYAQAGVREYWLVDPNKQRIDVYVLQGRVYELLGRFKHGDVACSEVLSGFKVCVDDVF
ncbi:MAG TPA: Uma2 family endonuclease [Methanosarcinales archaeon]|nr:Uma2 family endonuclease [Methanosarcinales archaeon]